MDSFVAWCVRRSGLLLTILAGYVAAFFASLSLTLFLAGKGWQSVPEAIASTLTLLLTLDSPAHVVPMHWLRVMSWVVCLSGWLFVPLVIGAFLNTSSERYNRNHRLKLIVRELGVGAGLSGQALREYEKKMRDKAKKIITGENERDGGRL